MSERPDSLDISAKLKDWRTQHSLMQTEAADLLGVPYDTFRGWETGRNCPRASHVLTIMYAIGAKKINDARRDRAT